MAKHIPYYWLLKFIKLYVQYFCASLASVPVGLLAFGLIKSGVNEFVSLSVAILFGLVITIFMWRLLDKILFSERQTVIKTHSAVPNINWQMQSIGGGACLASTIIIVAVINTVDPPKHTTEYKSLNGHCRTGTGTRMQMSR